MSKLEDPSPFQESPQKTFLQSEGNKSTKRYLTSALSIVLATAVGTLASVAVAYPASLFIYSIASISFAPGTLLFLSIIIMTHILVIPPVKNRAESFLESKIMNKTTETPAQAITEGHSRDVIIIQQTPQEAFQSKGNKTSLFSTLFSAIVSSLASSLVLLLSANLFYQVLPVVHGSLLSLGITIVMNILIVPPLKNGTQNLLESIESKIYGITEMMLISDVKKDSLHDLDLAKVQRAFDTHKDRENQDRENLMTAAIKTSIDKSKNKGSLASIDYSIYSKKETNLKKNKHKSQESRTLQQSALSKPHQPRTKLLPKIKSIRNMIPK